MTSVEQIGEEEQSINVEIPSYVPVIASCQAPEPIYAFRAPLIRFEIDGQRIEYFTSHYLPGNQYKPIKEFYDNANVNGLISSDQIRDLLNQTIKNRREVKASEEDVSRSLAAVDGDKDGKLTLDEFIVLLLLFFSSKHNIKERINNLLYAISEDEPTPIGPRRLAKFVSFLENFFGLESNPAYEYRVSLDAFTDEVVPRLESAAFVKWQH